MAAAISPKTPVVSRTMSSHLGVLARAGLITPERHSRSIVYRARLDCVREMVTFLLRGLLRRPPQTLLLLPVIDALTPCCSKEAANG